MQFPIWIKPALTGAGVGAVATAIVGFAWGGWVTGGTAQERADNQAVAAIAAVLTPYCLDRARNDPRSAEVLAELAAAPGYGRGVIVANAGWATPLGNEEPNTALAQACQVALAASP